ncbi:MAG: hypothetical protein ABI867_04455 [Kofleriaceae bacterium]
MPLLAPRQPIGVGIALGILGPTELTMIAYSYLCNTWWFVGEHDRALDDARYCLARARDRGDPYTLALALLVMARTHLIRRDPPDTIRAPCLEMLATAGAEVWHSHARSYLAAANSHATPLDDTEAGELIAQLHTRLRNAMGQTVVALPVLDALQRAGRVAQALAIADEMLAFCASHEERIVEPELIRIRGELIEASDRAGAEAAYRTAHANAAAMGAHSFALRAAMNLVELGCADGAQLARAALAQIRSTTAEVEAARQRVA